MKYLNEKDIKNIGIEWKDIILTIKDVTLLLAKKEFSQPIKPYLRYKDLKNRIIAMPAYIGGKNETAGIKWIASFPQNISKNIPRAHSTIILNDADTGKPYSIINTAIVSGIRTVGVSGMVISEYLEALQPDNESITVGIIGFGPIGQLHLDMLMLAFNDKVKNVLIFDLNSISPDNRFKNKVKVCSSWEEVYDQANILITCTVSSVRYINRAPKSPSLHLNVSLRDYEPEFVKYVNLMIVDNWDEVCRENTDVENMHLKYNLTADDVHTIDEIVTNKLFKDVKDKVVMFNPMGMAIYDIAVGQFYYNKSNLLNVGVLLQD